MKDFALKITVVFAILLVGLAIWQVRSIVMVFIVSLAITATVRAPIAYLIERKLRRGVAMLIVYGVGLGGLLILFYLLSFPLALEFTTLGDSLMQAYTQLQAGRAVFSRFDPLIADRLPTVEELAAILTGDQMTILGEAVLNFTQNIGSTIGQFLLAMVLSIYWTADQLRFERFWLSLLPVAQRARAREIWHSIEAQVGAYLRSEIVQSVLAGLLLAPGFWLMGVDYPLLWALLVSLAWFIPLVGWLIVVVPLWLMIALGEGTAIATGAVAYTLIVLAFLEFFVERRLYTQTRYTNVVVILVMLLMVDAYGIVGLLIAPPLATAIEVLLAKLVEKPAKSAAQSIPDSDVSKLRARLEETRQLLDSVDAPSMPRLVNMTNRLDGLLNQADEL
jgi:predicted PurR-regulated permease PerM